MRIALVGPFSGSSLESHFAFAADGGPLPFGYPGAPLMAVLARELADRGHRVAAISTDFRPPADMTGPFRRYGGDGIEAYFCPQRARGFRYSDGRWGRAMDLFAHERAALLEAIRDFRPDVIHAHWTYEFVWAALDSGYPTVATAHDSPLKVLRFMPDLYRALRFVMARRVIPRCRHLTAVSPDLAKDLARFATTAVEVVPNPVAAEVFEGTRDLAASFASRRVMMVLNGWNGLKNGGRALEAFAAARSKCRDLVLIGFGTDWQPGGPAHQWAGRRGLDDGVEFRGPVPRQVILDTMRCSTALLHPSRAEACSMVIAEAMSVGLPVVAGRATDGVSWQLDGGRAGMLVDVNDPGDMASGLIGISSNRGTWNDLSLRARQRAVELFSADRVVDQYLAAYRRAMPAESTAAAVAGAVPQHLNP